MVEVTQEDRIAASHVVQVAELGQVFVRGDYDHHPYVQAFARRRISAEQATVDRIVAFIKNRADETAPPEADEQDPLWTAFGYLHEVANAIQRGDWK